MPFMEEIEYKKYLEAMWNNMSIEQQVQIRKLHEQQGIKPTYKQQSADARIAASEARPRVNFHTGEKDVIKLDG